MPLRAQEHGLQASSSPRTLGPDGSVRRPDLAQEVAEGRSPSPGMAQVALPGPPPHGAEYCSSFPSLPSVLRKSDEMRPVVRVPSVPPPNQNSDAYRSALSSSSSTTASTRDSVASTFARSSIGEISRPPLWQTKHPVLITTRPSVDQSFSEHHEDRVSTMHPTAAGPSALPVPTAGRSTSVSSVGSDQGMLGQEMSRTGSDTSMMSASGDQGEHDIADDVGDDQPGKKKRTRALMTFVQSQHLKALWRITKFPSTEERERVAKDVGLTPRQVQVWFQNHRQSARKAMTENRGVPLDENPADYAVLQMSPRSRRMTQNAFEERMAGWAVGPSGPAGYGQSYPREGPYGIHPPPTTMASAPALGLIHRPIIDPFGRGPVGYAGSVPSHHTYPPPTDYVDRGHLYGETSSRLHPRSYDDHSFLGPDRRVTPDLRASPYQPEHRSRYDVHRSPTYPLRRAESEEPPHRAASGLSPDIRPAAAPTIKPIHLPPSLNRQVLTRPLEGSLPAEFSTLETKQYVRRHDSGPSRYAHSRGTTSGSSEPQPGQAGGVPGSEAMRREGSQSGVTITADEHAGPGPIVNSSPQLEKLPGINSILNSRD